MLFLTVSVFVMNGLALSLPVGLAVLLVIGLSGWLALRWPAMQFSILAIVLLFALLMLSGRAERLIEFMMPVSTVLLLASLLTAVAFELGKWGIKDRHSQYLTWSAVVVMVLLWLLRGTTQHSFDLNYAGLPLTRVDDFLILSTAAMAFVYLLYQRHYPRIQGDFIGLLPASILALFLNTRALDPLSLDLPAVVLEHALLLLHVPAMVLAFTLLANATVFAILRLLTDSAWLQNRQNRDVLETVQTGLDDYLHHLLALAILSMGLGLLTGMSWSSLAWGHYWFSEAKQVLSIAIWFYYLAGLHLRLQKGMQGRAFAWWLLGGLPLLWMVFIGTNLWPQGLHVFGEL